MGDAAFASGPGGGLGCGSEFNSEERRLTRAASAAGWGALNAEGEVGRRRRCPRAPPALGNAASAMLGRVLPDATDLLFCAQELSRQRCGILSLAVAAQGT